MMNLDEIFNSFTAVANDNKAVVLNYDLETVVEEDLEPASLINPRPTGPWICGGAVLSWYQGRPVAASDIDVFCFDQQQFDGVQNALMETGRAVVSIDTKNAITFMYTSENKIDTWKIQLIKKSFYDNIENVLDSFDISVCKIGTNGHRYIANDQTYNDIHNRVLRMEYPLREGAVKRFAKYIAYGYIPVSGLHQEIVSNTETKWEFDFSEDYDDV